VTAVLTMTVMHGDDDDESSWRCDVPVEDVRAKPSMSSRPSFSDAGEFGCFAVSASVPKSTSRYNGVDAVDDKPSRDRIEDPRFS
jgi:hypothetical protein